MQRALARIATRRAQYQKHAFIQYLLNDERTPQERLAYAPFISHFVLTFSEFNRHFLHSESDAEHHQDADQKVVNVHAEEDSRHYSWFLKDLRTLGYDPQCSFTEVLSFVWGDLGRRTREMGYYAIGAVRDAHPREKLALIEAVEAMGNVWLEATVIPARAHPDSQRLIYFGQHHLEHETGHTMGSDFSTTADIQLTDEQVERVVPLIDGLFDRMEAFNTEILERALCASKKVSVGEEPAAAFLHC